MNTSKQHLFITAYIQ